MVVVFLLLPSKWFVACNVVVAVVVDKLLLVLWDLCDSSADLPEGISARYDQYAFLVLGWANGPTVIASLAFDLMSLYFRQCWM